MPKKLQRSLQDYLSKIKNPNPNIQNSLSYSKNWILSGCKHPKTLSFAIDRNQNLTNIENGGANKGSEHHHATLSDVDRFLFENFRSLYIRDDGDVHQEDWDQKGKESEDDDDQQVPAAPGGILFESPRFLNPPPDLCGSDRFFVAPRSSGSLIEEARASLTTTSEDIGSSSTSTNTLNESITSSNDVPKKISLPDHSIAVLKYSSTPCRDFRRSMREMVEARLQQTGKLDWDFMEEILFWYLNLNERKSHKFVLNAFVDLVVELRKDSDKVPAKSRSSTRVARERRRLRKM